MRLRSLLALILCVLAFVDSARAESEATLKAASLFKFAQIMEWPASAFSDPKAPIVIGVLERDPVGDELRRFAGEKAQNRIVEVRRVSAGDPAELQGCHILPITQT